MRPGAQRTTPPPSRRCCVAWVMVYQRSFLLSHPSIGVPILRARASGCAEAGTVEEGGSYVVGVASWRASEGIIHACVKIETPFFV